MDTEKQQDISKVPKQLQPYAYKKGQSGNIEGRPKGKTLKEYCRDFLSCQSEEERQEFLEGLPKDLIWRMAEGNPQTNTDLTSQGKAINVTAVNWNITDGGEDIKSENT